MPSRTSPDNLASFIRQLDAATLSLVLIELAAELRRRLADTFDAGYRYDSTYLFPGIRKVVQAARRVIRTTSERGSVLLIDDRFARPEVLRLLPNWWNGEEAALESGFNG